MRIFPNCGGLKTSDGYISSLTKSLNAQRKSGHEEYCNVTLTCNGVRFSAHKSILSASSPYFECLLQGHFVESRLKEIDLSESIGDPDVLEQMLEFIYTGKVLIDGNNFCELLGASTILLLNDVTELLHEYLKSSLVIANCLEILEISYKYSLCNISQVCCSMIRARMHDYFCHGSKMVAVLPETFVHLCEQGVFTNTTKQDKCAVIKEYIENLKVSAMQVSQETASKLYQIAESEGIADAEKLFEGWVTVDKEEFGSKQVQMHGNDKTSGMQSDELLLVKGKAVEGTFDLFGWLNRESKWIKLVSVNCSSLGSFVGFAYNSMAFEINPSEKFPNQKGVMLVPFNEEVSNETRTCCDFCLKHVEDDSDKPCPHLYFTAWNELFCLFPKTFVHSQRADSDMSDDGLYHNNKWYNEKIMIEYQIAKYTPSSDTWIKVCTLEVPDVYCYCPAARPSMPRQQVTYLKFKAVIYGRNVLLSMVNYGADIFQMKRSNRVKYLTVMQLTKENDILKYEVKFHRRIEIDIAPFFARASLVCKFGKLKFQEIDVDPDAAFPPEDPPPARCIVNHNFKFAEYRMKFLKELLTVVVEVIKY